jgi:hypothetical protein
MRVGLQFVSFTWPGGTPEIARRLAEIARTAEEAGYPAVTPGWADDPETVDQAKALPETFAHKIVGRSPTISPR